ncbi:unnamed protein product [Amaranthus hypochondriacus]
MDINGVRNFRHRKSPHSGSDLFLGHFTFSSTSSSDDHSGDEFTEADLFWSGENGITDSDESTRYPYSSHSHRSLGFRRREKSGILAALPDDCVNGFKTPLRAIPKAPQCVSGEMIQSSPCQKFQHSAPVNIPSTIMTRKKPKKFGQLEERESRDGDGDDEETLPPHEIVAMKLKSTSSVLEGVGRTLKGRDLRQVRNAVWRQTGFLD